MTDKILGRDDILTADDRAPIPVKVPEWGGTVLVLPLTGKERDAYEQSQWRRNPKTGMNEPYLRPNNRARLAAHGIVDRDGNRLFDPDDKRDLAALGAKSSHGLDRVVEAIREASGLDSDYVEDAAEDFDEAEPAGVASSSV